MKSQFRKETRRAFLARQVKEARQRLLSQHSSLLQSVQSQGDLNRAAATLVAKSGLTTRVDMATCLSLCQHGEARGLRMPPAVVAYIERQDEGGLPVRTFTQCRALRFGRQYQCQATG